MSYNKAMIATHKGLKAMEDIKVGDKLVDPETNIPAVVEQVLPQKDGVELFELKLEDGRKTVVTKDHLWRVFDSNGVTMLYTSEQVMDCAVPLFIKAQEPIDCKPITVEIDPYVVGCYLGNGYAFGLSVKEIEVAKAIRESLSSLGCKLADAHGMENEYCVVPIDTSEQAAKDSMLSVSVQKYSDALGGTLFNDTVLDRAVPDVWFNGSLEQRFDIVKGLIDTCGMITLDEGTCFISVVSEKLKSGIVGLIQSIGGYVKEVSVEERPYHTYHTKLDAVDTHVIEFVLPAKLGCPSKLEDNVEKFTGEFEMKKYLKIEKVKPAGTGFATHIVLDSPNKLYIADNVVTHNCSL